MSRLSFIKEELSSVTTSPDVRSHMDPNTVNSPTQFFSNLVSPPSTTSSTISRLHNVNKHYPSPTSVRANPANGRQGLVKKVERDHNSNRPFILNRNNKFASSGSNVQQMSFNVVELQLKQAQEELSELREKLAESRNANSILGNKYDQLQLDHLKFRSNANKSMEELKSDNVKLRYKLDQLAVNQLTLIANVNNAQTTHETSQANTNIYIKQEYEDGERAQQVNCNEPEIKIEFDYGQIEIKKEEEEEGETAQQISDTSNNELAEHSLQVAQIVNTEFELAPNEYNFVDLFDVKGEHSYTQFAVNRKRELDFDGDGAIQLNTNEGDEESEMNEQPINTQAEVMFSGQSTDKAQPNQLNSDKHYITVHLQCLQSDCTDTFAEDQLNRHMWNKHFIRPHRCLVKDCGQSFDNTNILGQHITEAHSEWHCDKCSKQFNAYQLLSIHTIKQHHFGYFQCAFDACPFTGEYKRQMYNHYARQHKPTLNCPYPDCTYHTANPSHLKQHQRIHSEVKPYRCKWPQCDYAGKQKNQTIRHIRRHIALNPNAVLNGAQLGGPNEYLEEVHEL